MEQKACSVSLSQRCVVHMLNWRTSKIPSLMQLLHSLLLSAARFNFSFSAEHIPGVHNQIADALSRIRWQEFRRLAPADSSPAPVGIDQLSLEQRCHSFLVHGLAPSSRKNARRKFFNFCLQLRQLHPSGSPCPACNFSGEIWPPFDYQGLLVSRPRSSC